MKFSLHFFSSQAGDYSPDKYKLFQAASLFADRHQFEAIWIPERHFHKFGGLFPNPAVLAAAIAPQTEQIAIRAGSVVLPLHNPVRVAEDWAVVDNLSHGRAGISFATGWSPNDFVLAPDGYKDRLAVMHEGIQTIQKLWRGEQILQYNGRQEPFSFSIYPQPKQKMLPTWLTCSGSPARFQEAGEIGANVLTGLNFQPMSDLKEKIEVYRAAYTAASSSTESSPEGAGHVTLLLHTFVGDTEDEVRQTVKQPFMNYLSDSIDLWGDRWNASERLSGRQRELILAAAFERFYQTKALFGTPSSCAKIVHELQAVGVDEIACLIDFGVDTGRVMEGLVALNQLRIDMSYM